MSNLVDTNFSYIPFPISFSTQFFTASINECNVNQSNLFVPIFGFNKNYSFLSHIAVQAYYNQGSISVGPKILAIGY